MANEGIVLCSICLESVVEHGGRATARLGCNHRFHLDCIGSAFNCRRRMICPNCRSVEQGDWLGPHPVANELDDDETPQQQPVQRRQSYEEASLHYMQHHLQYQRELLQFLRNVMTTQPDQQINRLLRSQELGRLMQPTGYLWSGDEVTRPPLWDGALPRVSASRSSRYRTMPYDRPGTSGSSSRQYTGNTSRELQPIYPAFLVEESIPIMPTSNQADPDIEPDQHSCPHCPR